MRGFVCLGCAQTTIWICRNRFLILEASRNNYGRLGQINSYCFKPVQHNNFVFSFIFPGLRWCNTFTQQHSSLRLSHPPSLICLCSCLTLALPPLYPTQISVFSCCLSLTCFLATELTCPRILSPANLCLAFYGTTYINRFLFIYFLCTWGLSYGLLHHDKQLFQQASC